MEQTYYTPACDCPPEAVLGSIETSTGFEKTGVSTKVATVIVRMNVTPRCFRCRRPWTEKVREVREIDS